MNYKKIMAAALTITIIILVYGVDADTSTYELHETEDYFQVDIHSVSDYSFFLDKASGIQHGFTVEGEYTTKWCLKTDSIAEVCVDSLEPTITVDENTSERIVLKVEPTLIPQHQIVVRYVLDANYTWPQYVAIQLEGRTVGHDITGLEMSWLFEDYDLYNDGVFDENLEVGLADGFHQYPLQESFAFDNNILLNFFGVISGKFNEFQWHEFFIEDANQDYSFKLESYDGNTANKNIRWIGKYGDIGGNKDFNVSWIVHDPPSKTCSLGMWTCAISVNDVDGSVWIRGADHNVGAMWSAVPFALPGAGCTLSWTEVRADSDPDPDWRGCQAGDKEDIVCTDPLEYCYTTTGQQGYLEDTWGYRLGATWSDITSQTNNIICSKAGESKTFFMLSVSNNAPVVEVVHPNGGEEFTIGETIDLNWTFSDADEVSQTPCSKNPDLNVWYLNSDREVQIIGFGNLLDYCTITDNNYATPNTCSYINWEIPNDCNSDWDLNVAIRTYDFGVWADDDSDAVWTILCAAIETAVKKFTGFDFLKNSQMLEEQNSWIWLLLFGGTGFSLLIGLSTKIELPEEDKEGDEEDELLY